MRNLYYYLGILVLSALLVSCSSHKKVYNDKLQNQAFTTEEIRLIKEGESDQAMRVFEVDNESDLALLRSKSSDANPKAPTLKLFVDRLLSTVKDSASLGVGIAAPQVGILKKIIWVQRFDKKGYPFELYLNPRIIQYSKKKQTCLEGCLSVPERRDTLYSRSYAILIEYDKIDSTHHVEMVEDFTAVIFQHEIDHLNGILYTDLIKKQE